MPHMNSSSDDLTFTDEVKVYKDEGDEEEQEKSAENLKEDKVGLVNEGEEKTPLEFDIYNKQYAASMFKVPFSTDPRFANYFMSNYSGYMNGSSNPSTFMGNKMPLMSSSVQNPFNFIPFPIHDPFAQNIASPRYLLPDPKRIAAAAAAHFYSLPSTSQLHEAWNCDVLSQQQSLLGAHNHDNNNTTKSTPNSSANRISFSVSSIADSDKNNSSRILTDSRSTADFPGNNSVLHSGMPLSPSMFAAAAVAAAQAAAFSSSNSSPDVSSLHKAAAAHLRFLSSLHYQKQQHSPASNGLNMVNCYSNPDLVSSRNANQGKYHNYGGPPMHQKTTADDRKPYTESLVPDRYHQSSDSIRHVSGFPGDNSSIEPRKTLYSSRNSVDQRGSVTSPDSPKKPHIKKPLNAFMLFMKEMRPKVQEECTLKESAAINQILGKKWHELSREDQTKYYELARKEKELHQQLYPGWSARDNYASHAKRRKKRKLLNSSMLNSRDGFLSMNMMPMNHYGPNSSGYGDRHPCDMRTNRSNTDSGSRNNSMDILMCSETGRRPNGASIQGMHASGPTTNGSNPKKCRARFGLEHQNLWCKPCRRKKKCVRFIYNTTDDSLAELVQTINPDSTKQENRMRHARIDSSYLNKSPPLQNNRHISSPGMEHLDEIGSYHIDANSSFRSFSLMNHSSNNSSNVDHRKSPNFDYFSHPKKQLRLDNGDKKFNRKRHISVSSIENDDQTASHSPPSSSENKDKLINRSVSNHSIEYHLNSKFESSQNNSNSNGQLSSSDMIGFEFSANNHGNSFALDKVLSNEYVAVSKSSLPVSESEIHKLSKWEASVGNPQSITTISTPPTPAMYSELEYSSLVPQMSHLNRHCESRNESPPSIDNEKSNKKPNKSDDDDDKSNNNNNNNNLHDKIKQEHDEFRDPSDSSQHYSESVASEPLRLSTLTPLVK